jgi:hypothetical protein
MGTVSVKSKRDAESEQFCAFKHYCAALNHHGKPGTFTTFPVFSGLASDSELVGVCVLPRVATSEPQRLKGMSAPAAESNISIPTG